ncbi:MAG TPA: hypothetical protein VFT13_00380 [Candidatus Krumholzibacteria bacterium]|nr:hypothetical protein [Candidatus Krumholzibacteria bacterium]
MTTGARVTALPVVPYEHERHLEGLLSLYARVLGEEACARRRVLIEAIHERMPGRDRHPLRYVVMDGDRVAGTLGCLPADFIVNGERVPARFTCDLLVDPHYAAAGLRLERRTLGTLLVERARLGGGFFVGGLWMTRASHKIHLAAGFSEAMVLPSYTLPLDPMPFVARRELGRVKAVGALAALALLRAGGMVRARLSLQRRDIRVEAVDRIDATLDATLLDLARGYAVTRVRDAAYLNWKYASHPTLGYRILIARRACACAGYVVWRGATPDDECRRAVVVDFLTAEGDARALRRLVSRVVIDAASEGMESVSILTTQPWARTALRQLGFLPRPGGNSWVVAGWEDHVPPDWLHEPERWHLCSGDSDGDMCSGIVAMKPGASSPPRRLESA